MKTHGQIKRLKEGALKDVVKGKGRYDLISTHAMKRLALILEKSTDKYPARDWEKGRNFSSLYNSAIRHLNQFAEGQIDEDHLGAAFWNIMAMIHFEVTKPHLNDLTKGEENGKTD